VELQFLTGVRAFKCLPPTRPNPNACSAYPALAIRVRLWRVCSIFPLVALPEPSRWIPVRIPDLAGRRIRTSVRGSRGTSHNRIFEKPQRQRARGFLRLHKTTQGKKKGENERQ